MNLIIIGITYYLAIGGLISLYLYWKSTEDGQILDTNSAVLAFFFFTIFWLALVVVAMANALTDSDWSE